MAFSCLVKLNKSEFLFNGFLREHYARVEFLLRNHLQTNDPSNRPHNYKRAVACGHEWRERDFLFSGEIFCFLPISVFSVCDWLIATMSQTTTPHIFFVAAAFLQLLLPGDRQILILFPWRALRQLARGREKVSWFLLSAVQHTLLPIRPCRAPTHILNHSLFLFSSSFSQLPHPPLRAG